MVLTHTCRPNTHAFISKDHHGVLPLRQCSCGKETSHRVQSTGCTLNKGLCAFLLSTAQKPITSLDLNSYSPGGGSYFIGVTQVKYQSKQPQTGLGGLQLWHMCTFMHPPHSWPAIRWYAGKLSPGLAVLRWEKQNKTTFQWCGQEKWIWS